MQLLMIKISVIINVLLPLREYDRADVNVRRQRQFDFINRARGKNRAEDGHLL